MRSLFRMKKSPGPPKPAARASDSLRVNSAGTPFSDLEISAANAAAAGSAPSASKEGGGGPSPASSNAASGQKLLREQPSGLLDGRTAGINPPVAEGGPTPNVFVARNSTKKDSGKGLNRLASRILPSEEHSILLMDSASSVSFVKKSTMRSSSKSAVDGEKLSWTQQAKKRLERFFCFTGRLGLKVNPMTLTFLDKDIEKEWLTMRAECGSKAFLWLGALLLLQLCCELSKYSSSCCNSSSSSSNSNSSSSSSSSTRLSVKGSPAERTPSSGKQQQQTAANSSKQQQTAASISKRGSLLTDAAAG
ncbi:hypothetical protein Emag_002540 [Eimeria magna]